MRKFKKVLKAIGKGLLVLLIVGAVVHGIASFILGRRLEAEIAKIKATGVPIALTELGKPKVPDEENAAVIYTKIIKDLTGMVLNPNGGKLISQRPGPPVAVTDISKPKPSDRSVIDGFINAKPEERTSEMWDETRKVVAKHRNILPLLEEATSRPKCQFPTNWEDGVNALFPHFSPMKQISRLLYANALIQARDGRMDEAVHSIELGFKLSESLQDDPSLIGQLVSIANFKMTSKSLYEVLEYGSINEVQAKQLYDTLAKVDMYPGLNKAMLSERCYGIWIFNFILRQPASFQEFFNSMRGVSHKYTASQFLLRILIGIWRPVLYADELTYLKLINKDIELMRLPYREMYSQMVDLEAETQHLPRYAIVSRVLFPIFARAAASRDDATAEIAACRIILALQAHKDRFGAYPASLDELRTRLGWDIPKDVFSNKDFIYSRQGNGFLLYSVGQNFKDDGAIPSSVLPSQRTERYDYKMDGKDYADIVWQMGK